MLAIALLFSALWAAVAPDRQLLRPEVTDDEVNFGYLLIAVVAVPRVRGDEAAAEPS